MQTRRGQVKRGVGGQGEFSSLHLNADIRGQATLILGILFNLENLLVVGIVIILFGEIDNLFKLIAAPVIVVANLYAMCELFRYFEGPDVTGPGAWGEKYRWPARSRDKRDG